MPSSSIWRAEVRGQDDDRIFEVYGSALRVGDSAVVEDLQQHVEHVRVRLFNLVEQNDRVRTGGGPLRSADRLPHSPRIREARRSDATRRISPYTRDMSMRMRFFSSSNSACGKRFGELRFADAGRTEEQERADRTVRVLDAGAATLDCFGNDADCLVLPDDALVERIFQMQQLFALRLPSAARPGCRSSAR